MLNWTLLRHPMNYAVVGSFAFIVIFLANLVLPAPKMEHSR